MLEAIRADPATRLLPVVMMTGYATSAERARAQAEGVTDFIPKPFSPHELLPRVRALVMLKQFADEHEHAERVILTLAKTIDARDPYTAGHSGRVADWADRIAERMGMDSGSRNDMRRGALFHDIGRIVVPDAILRKPGVLTAEERQVIEEHPTVGFDLLEPMKTMRRALPIVRGHHEKLDGSGYPRGLSAPDITLPVRIVAVADVFDALVSDRAYRRAFSLAERHGSPLRGRPEAAGGTVTSWRPWTGLPPRNDTGPEDRAPVPFPLAEASPVRIFVVDDDEQIRQLLSRLLTPAGYAVEEFGTAADVLERIRVEAPDLVLLDLGLPDLSGHEVLESIRADPATRLLPVVMLTGMGTTAEKRKAQSEGVTDFLSKPFSPEELLPRVRALVMLKQFADEHEHAERVILTLAKTIDARDPYTAGHSGRVAEYADRIAARMGMDAAVRNDMRRGALFHDLGKIVIPDAILRKPGILTAEEREVIEQHPVVGHDLLSPMRTMRKTLPIVFHHHERLDGSGYPEGCRARRSR